MFQFVAFGALLFALTKKPEEATVVRVDARVLEERRAIAVAKNRGRPLTPDEDRDIVNRVVEDELFVREARVLGLEVDDPIIRNRLVQKMLFLAEDVGGASHQPTEEELRAYFESHRDSYRRAERVEFVHAFFRKREDAALSRDAMRRWSESAPNKNQPPPFGEAFPLNRFVVAKMSDVSQSFGDDFGSAIATLPIGEVGPVLQSRYGFHLVRVNVRDTERHATFEEARPSLPLDYVVYRREKAVAEYAARLLKKYRVIADGRRVTRLESTKRTAPHGALSGED